MATKQLKILVAEDNLINQKVIAKILDKFNYVPIIVPNGYEAVKEVEKNEYDCVFMDLLMPVMNGIEATKTICGLDWTNKTTAKPTIIAMTASASEEDRLMCYNAGMDYHISKPVNIEIIKKTLDLLERGKQKYLKTLDSIKT